MIFPAWLVQMAAVSLHQHDMFTLLFRTCFYSLNNTMSFTKPKVFYSKVNYFASLFQVIFQAFWPFFLWCYISLLYRLSLHSAHRRIICFFPACPRALSLICSLTPPCRLSLLSPVVAMPPHRTVIIWSLIAAMITVRRLQGDLKCVIEASALMLKEIT